jgi:hypothetical protein
MIDATVALIRRWTTQDVARTNAAQASASLRLRRLQLEEVDAYVARLAEEHTDHPSGDRRLGAPDLRSRSEGHVDER